MVIPDLPPFANLGYVFITLPIFFFLRYEITRSTIISKKFNNSFNLNSTEVSNSVVSEEQIALPSSGGGGPGFFTCPLEPQFIDLVDFYFLSSLLFFVLAIFICYFWSKKKINKI